MAAIERRMGNPTKQDVIHCLGMAGVVKTCSEFSARISAMVNQRATKRPVRICDCGAHAFVSLTRGFVALVSPEDSDLVGQWTWTALYMSGREPRAIRRSNETGKTLYLHREIARAGADMMIDHADGNTLNNCRWNLRRADHQRNMWNARPKHYGRSSRFKGVTFDKATNRWAADIRAGQRYRLGRFDTEEEAALAYDRKAVEVHGAFARTNKSLGLLP